VGVKNVCNSVNKKNDAAFDSNSGQLKKKYSEVYFTFLCLFCNIEDNVEFEFGGIGDLQKK